MKKEEKGKVLFIEMTKDIQKVIYKYCKESNINRDDLGFAMGWLTGNLNPKGIEQLMFLLQIYFFSGVYYAKTTKTFRFQHLSKEERQKTVTELNKKLMDIIKQKKKDERPSYMG